MLAEMLRLRPMTIAVAFAVVLTMSLPIMANPIVPCDNQNLFVAHDHSLCMFYQCVGGVPFEFACAKGSRVPSYFYTGNSNPCTVRVKNVMCVRCNVSDDRIPDAKVSNQCALFQPCRTRPGCTCIDQVAGYYCSCPVSTALVAPTPAPAPLPLCEVNVCQNGGTCYELYKNKFCNCKPPWTGKNCESNACDSTVCNNGECLWDNFGIYCQCERCFTGKCCDSVLTSGPGCGNCSTCYGGDTCSQLRTHLCKCNPCPDEKDTCRNGVFGRRERSCFKPPTTASDSFTLAFEDNFSDPPYNLEVYVSAAEDDNLTRTVTVDTPLGTPECSFSETAVIPGGVVKKFDVSICLKQLKTGKAKVGIRVREINGKLINVYNINRAQWSADGWLALPDKVAGKLFTVISYSPIISASQFSVLAIANNTVVKVLLSNASEDLPGSGAGRVLAVTLNAYETYQVKSAKFDLSGSVVFSNNPVHVYSGEARAWVGPSPAHPDYASTAVDGYSKSRDNLILECPGAEAWGRTYALVPLPRAFIGYAYTEEVVRVAGTAPTACTYYSTPAVGGSAAVGSHSQSTLTLDARTSFVAQFYIDASRNYFIDCDQPVEIVEITESALRVYATGNDANFNNVNDPSFIFVPAISSYSNFYNFVPPVFSRTNAPYLYTYVRLIADVKDYQGIEINDELLYPFPPPEKEVLKPWSAIYVPASSPRSDYPSLYGAIFRISSSSQTNVLHPDRYARFACVVEGFDDRESYGVVVGANITSLRSTNDIMSTTLLTMLNQTPFLTVQ